MKITAIILFLIPLTSFASGFKIFSMNLHCGLGDWQQRMNIVVAEILKQNPDVIGLQEVCYNDKMNMANYIRDGLMKAGYPIKTMETQDTHRSFVKYQEQLLIMSRHESSATKKGNLPSVKLLQNGFVAIQIGKQWFLTTHLHFAIASVRKTQYSFINENFGQQPTIIFGDLNSNPDDSETKVLSDANWTSMFDGPTYPSDGPEKTFDGFWMTKSFYDEVTATTMERIFFNTSMQPSDHIGVQLTLLSR